MNELDKRNMIASCEQCENSMDISKLRPFSKVKCPHCAHEMRVRKQLGNYEIINLLGKGGMSVVYRALDLGLKREVALKILNERYASQPARIASFEKEARVMAKVSHENIVKVFTVGSDHGCVFIAMELVEGIDLETYLSEHGAQSEAVMLEMAIQSVQGLKVAGDAGLVHRDIKPANLIFDPKTRVVKVLDFGLADFQTDTNTTAEIWATPYYVAPETLKRETEDLRSDMFALGVTLMQLLTSTPPFSSEHRSTKKLIQLKEEFGGIRTLRPKTSAGVADVLDTMMAFSPQDRYNSYDELLVDLFALQNQSKRAGSEVKSVETLAQRRRDDRRMKMTLIGVGVGLVASLVLGVSMLMGGNKQEVVAPNKMPQRNAPTGVDKTKQVQNLFAEFEHACLQGNVGKARESLSSLLQAELPLLTHVPCAIQQAICAGLADRPNELVTVLMSCTRHIKEQGAPVSAMSESERKSLLEMEKVLTFGTERIGVAIPDGLSPMNRLLAEMLDLLRHWHNGHLKEVVGIATEMNMRWHSEALPISEQKMIKTWKPMLVPLLALIGNVREVQSMPETTVAELSDKLSKLSNLDASVQSGTAIKTSLSDWRKEIESQKATLEKREKMKLAAEAQRKRDEEEAARTQKENEAAERGGSLGYLGDDDDGATAKPATARTKNAPVHPLSLAQMKALVLKAVESGWKWDEIIQQTGELVSDSASTLEDQIVMIELDACLRDAKSVCETLNMILAKVPADRRMIAVPGLGKVPLISFSDGGVWVQSPAGQGVGKVFRAKLTADNIGVLDAICTADNPTPAEFRRRRMQLVSLLFLLGESAKATDIGNKLVADDSELKWRWTNKQKALSR